VQADAIRGNAAGTGRFASGWPRITLVRPVGELTHGSGAPLRRRARARGGRRLHGSRSGLPEIVTYGVDEAEALVMAEGAIRLVTADMQARGEPVPSGAPPRIREVSVTLAA
jgi:predicted RNase H-like HicB family nuclease